MFTRRPAQTYEQRPFLGLPARSSSNTYCEFPYMASDSPRIYEIPMNNRSISLYNVEGMIESGQAAKECERMIRTPKPGLDIRPAYGAPTSLSSLATGQTRGIQDTRETGTVAANARIAKPGDEQGTIIRSTEIEQSRFECKRLIDRAASCPRCTDNSGSIVGK